MILFKVIILRTILSLVLHVAIMLGDESSQTAIHSGLNPFAKKTPCCIHKNSLHIMHHTYISLEDALVQGRSSKPEFR